MSCDPTAVPVRRGSEGAVPAGHGASFGSTAVADGKVTAALRRLGPARAELEVRPTLHGRSPDGDYDSIGVQYTVDRGKRRETLEIPVRIVSD